MLGQAIVPIVQVLKFIYLIFLIMLQLEWLIKNSDEIFGDGYHDPPIF